MQLSYVGTGKGLQWHFTPHSSPRERQKKRVGERERERKAEKKRERKAATLAAHSLKKKKAETNKNKKRHSSAADKCRCSVSDPARLRSCASNFKEQGSKSRDVQRIPHEKHPESSDHFSENQPRRQVWSWWWEVAPHKCLLASEIYMAGPVQCW